MKFIDRAGLWPTVTLFSLILAGLLGISSCGDTVSTDCSQDEDCQGMSPPPCGLAASAECRQGTCHFPNAPVGTPCDDGNPCTTDEACDEHGACFGVDVACLTPPDVCQEGDIHQGHELPGTCDAHTGQCDYVALEPVPCAPYRCDELGVECREDCSSDQHCASEHYCADTVCLPEGDLAETFWTEDAGEGHHIEQYGITWSFAEPVRYGRFINGDYFVVGPVTITAIDPPWVADQWGYMRNGTMLNVTGGGHGLDAYTGGPYGAMGYSDELNIEANGGLPLRIEGNASVVSAIGRVASASDENLRPRLQTVAVLTVLDSVPYADAFRPSYVGTDKTMYRWAHVESNLWRLPELSPVSDTPPVDSYIENMKMPWLLNVADWEGRYFHPSVNMPGSYHRDIGRFLARASVLLMMNVADREELLKYYIQLGIDYYAIGQHMVGTSSQWQWPVIFTGIMLGDSRMRDVYLSDYSGERHPGNDTRSHRQLYRLPDDQRSKVESGIVDAGVTWTGRTAAWRQSTTQSDCYEQEHLHPTEWAAVTSAQNCSQGLATRETYRRINSPAYVGFAAAGAAMGARDGFYRSDLFFEYAERWKEEDLDDPNHDAFGNPPYTSGAAEYGSSTSTFVDNFWNDYYDSFD